MVQMLWIIIPRDDRARDSSIDNAVQSGSEEVREQVSVMGEDVRHLIQHPNPHIRLIFNVIWALLIILASIVFLTRHLRGD